jgi:uncharacterized lipoprotein YehR (DUF1307 family)
MSAYDPDTLDRLEVAYKRGAEILKKDDGFDAETFAYCVFHANRKEDAELILEEAIERYRGARGLTPMTIEATADLKIENL